MSKRPQSAGAEEQRRKLSSAEYKRIAKRSFRPKTCGYDRKTRKRMSKESVKGLRPRARAAEEPMPTKVLQVLKRLDKYMRLHQIRAIDLFRRREFNASYASGDDKLSVDELSAALEKMGAHIHLSEVKSVVNWLDNNGDSEVDLSELEHVLRRAHRESAHRDEMTRIASLVQKHPETDLLFMPTDKAFSCVRHRDDVKRSRKSSRHSGSIGKTQDVRNFRAAKQKDRTLVHALKIIRSDLRCRRARISSLFQSGGGAVTPARQTPRRLRCSVRASTRNRGRVAAKHMYNVLRSHYCSRQPQQCETQVVTLPAQSIAVLVRYLDHQKTGYVDIRDLDALLRTSNVPRPTKLPADVGGLAFEVRAMYPRGRSVRC